MKQITIITIQEVSELQHVTFGSDGLILVEVKGEEDHLSLHAPLEFWIEAAKGARQVSAALAKIT